MQPYEKFMTYGSASLTDAELLAIMIRTGTGSRSAHVLGEELLEMLPGKRLSGLYALSVNDLERISGIGEVKAVRLKCIAELATRISRAKKSDHLDFRRASTVAQYYMEDFRHLDHERVLVVLLDMKLQRICERIISVGSASSAVVSSREVYIEALRYSASKVILLHNHPSGDPNPSPEDISFTAQVAGAGKLLRIPLLDHIIIGDQRYISLAEKGLL